MPVKVGKDSKGCYARWGSQKKYYFACSNEASKQRAIAKAEKQGKAAYASGYKKES